MLFQILLNSLNQKNENLFTEIRRVQEYAGKASNLFSLVQLPISSSHTIMLSLCLSLCVSADITLDPNTAHPRLIVSMDGKQVHCGDRHQQVPDNPERFDRVVCLLARQGFRSGRHYWEV